ncbi:MAG: hypothetical protein R8K49_03850 [Mariprofundaceae bacterium]
MIVDNKDVIREIAAAMLEDMDFETLMVSDAQRQLKFIQYKRIKITSA